MKVARGLAGVSVTETRIGKSDADGSLVYRGYPIRELTDNASFEETAYLVTNGALPTRDQLEGFAAALRAETGVPQKVLEVMRELGTGAHPIDAIRTACSALGSLDGSRSVRAQQTSIEAKLSVLAANSHRVPMGQDARIPRGDLGFAANLLHMLTDRQPRDYELWVFERALILYMEHDLNASSFTVRVVASTQADPYAAVSAGLASLKGPLHGGANEAAMEMLLNIREPENVPAYLDKELGEGRKVVGFGHRIYKRSDPRALILKDCLKEILKRRGSDDRLYRLCDTMEREMMQRKSIPPNLDFYAAPVFYLLGVEVPLYTPIFAASRVFGWMAHYDEQAAENKLIRPDATYIGPTDLRYVPVESRPSP
ncbi:MAG TPA: citrate/2-methylcitrate synthase [Nitrososphaerales archaeon]|nr:citrate/2-methylcitrate synthase [Nitrososphaerales archaeon]